MSSARCGSSWAARWSGRWFSSVVSVVRGPCCVACVVVLRLLQASNCSAEENADLVAAVLEVPVATSCCRVVAVGGWGLVSQVPAMKKARTHEVEEAMDIGSGKEVAALDSEVGQWVYMCACMGSIHVSACALAPVVIVLLSFQVPAVVNRHLDASEDKKEACFANAWLFTCACVP